MTTDLQNETHYAPRRRYGAALVCLFGLGIALFAYFVEGQTGFAVIMGLLSIHGVFHYSAKIHGQSRWVFTPDFDDSDENDVVTNPVYSGISCNIYHEPDRVRDD